MIRTSEIPIKYPYSCTAHFTLLNIDRNLRIRALRIAHSRFRDLHADLRMHHHSQIMNSHDVLLVLRITITY